MRPAAAVLSLSLLAAACGPGAIPPPSLPDDPSTVRVIVFMRDESGTELWVNFDTAADGRSAATIGATSNVVVACEIVPAGGHVAVVAVPGLAVRLPLYTASRGDADRVLWVDSGAGGDLGQGLGRPDWGTVTPECPSTS